MNDVPADLGDNAKYLQPVRLVRDQAIFLISRDNIILTWNVGVELILGYREEEFVGMNASQIFTAEDQLAGAVEREQALAIKEGWANDERWHKKIDGSRFWANGSLTPVKDSGGNVTGFVKAMRDATQSRNSRIELEAREKLFRVIVETANEGIVMLSSTGDVRFCNSQLAEMIGEPPESIIGKQFAQYIAEADKDVIHRCFTLTEDCGREQHQVCLKSISDKSGKWVLASVSPLQTDARGILCMMADITETRKATEELALREARFKALVENSSGAISMINSDGKIIYSSPALERSLGYAPEELKIKNKFDLLHPNDRESIVESLSRLISSPGRSITKEYRMLRADGSYCWREGVATNLFNDPAVQAIVINSHDVTEKKLAEQMAQEALTMVSHEKISSAEASKEKNAYLGNMSHEIRTPLNAIIGYAELMIEQSEHELPPVIRRDLERIATAGRHLLELVTGILDLSKIEAGKMELHLQEVDLLEQVRQVTDSSKSLFTRNRNNLHVDAPAGPLVMVTDPLKFRQILLNLLSNSAKFTTDGDIFLRIQQITLGDQAWIRLTVEDTGIGMTRQQLAALFEPYSSRTSDSREPGTGLGLVLTRRFCQLLKGDITAESEPGNGASFTVSLPVDPDVGYEATVEQGP